MISQIFKLYDILLNKNYIIVIATVFLALASSLFEIFSIGLLIPLLNLVVKGGGGHLFSINFSLIHIIILFGVVSIFSGFLRLLQLYWNSRVAFELGTRLNHEIYKRLIFQSFKEYNTKKTSDIIDVLTKKADNVIYGVLLQSINFVTSCILAIFILSIVVFIDPFISISTFSLIGIIYLMIMLIGRSKLKSISAVANNTSSVIIKSIQESFGMFKDIILDRSQNTFLTQFDIKDSKLRRAQSEITFLTAYPRYAIESCAMLGISFVIYFYLDSESGVNSLIPILGMMAISSQRLLPVMQIIYSSWANIVACQEQLYELNNILSKDITKSSMDVAKTKFNSVITLDNVSVCYENNFILNNININLLKGNLVAIVGASGSGKSTFIDLLLGFLKPDTGTILVDGSPRTDENLEHFQTLFSHVPQNIYLIDGSIEENITLNSFDDNVDRFRLTKCINQSGLSDFVSSLPLGIDTLVGENGSWISGGQRQRIGIARALYKGSEILVLDESTSALDSDTERFVIMNLQKLKSDITIIIVTHNEYVIRSADIIFEISNKSIKEVRYEDL
jgi:ABC-type bacteriocin/lantibiotic exporter with double-glycine peptidase domain